MEEKSQQNNPNSIFQGNNVSCPACDSVPHLLGTKVWRPKGSSGHALLLLYECESDHRFFILFEDHSGGTWISQKLLEAPRHEP